MEVTVPLAGLAHKFLPCLVLTLFLQHQLSGEDAEDLEEDRATIRKRPVSSNDLKKYRLALTQTLF